MHRHTSHAWDAQYPHSVLLYIKATCINTTADPWLQWFVIILKIKITKNVVWTKKLKLRNLTGKRVDCCCLTVSQSYTILLRNPVLIAREMKFQRQTHLTHCFYLPLCSFDYENAVKRRADVLRTGWADCAAWSCLYSRCIQCSPGTFKILLAKDGALLGPRSSSVHHRLIIIPLLVWTQKKKYI